MVSMFAIRLSKYCEYDQMKLKYWIILRQNEILWNANDEYGWAIFFWQFNDEKCRLEYQYGVKVTKQLLADVGMSLLERKIVIVWIIIMRVSWHKNLVKSTLNSFQNDLKFMTKKKICKTGRSHFHKLQVKSKIIWSRFYVIFMLWHSHNNDNFPIGLYLFIKQCCSAALTSSHYTNILTGIVYYQWTVKKNKTERYNSSVFIIHSPEEFHFLSN